ncbi:AMP-binding protein [Streptomyces sp. NPDC059752]|uniref:AMP-binding protein n=1 Tax=unclassified Streptomyces TaxID=2593676 RepID=UPI0036517364
MGYQELTPKALLHVGHGADEVNDTAWRVRWDEVGGFAEREDLVLGMLPPELDFHTSGSTGPGRRWLRTRQDAWSESGMLADFVRGHDDREPPGAVVSFAPPRHVYGALAGLLMPARLGVPVWYRKHFAGAMPATGQRHVAVVATPWIFALLLRHLDWVRSFDHLTVLYSSAMLPGDALTFMDRAGAGRVTLVEILGSTETGGIATRRWREGEPPVWTLFPDVRFAAGPSAPEPVAVEADAAIPLVIHSPRLARRPDEDPPDHWPTGDLVERVDDRTFRLVGRIGRLVKVNGRRINLDESEHILRAAVRCADLALVAVSDPMTGEQVDLHVVPETGSEDVAPILAEVFALLGVRPRRVHLVARLDRSETGKLRQPPTPYSQPGRAT